MHLNSSCAISFAPIARGKRERERDRLYLRPLLSCVCEFFSAAFRCTRSLGIREVSYLGLQAFFPRGGTSNSHSHILSITRNTKKTVRNRGKKRNREHTSSFASFVFFFFFCVCVCSCVRVGKRERFHFGSLLLRIESFVFFFSSFSVVVALCSLSLSLSSRAQRVNSGAKKKTIALLSLLSLLLLMMMTSTSFNAWLPIIKLGTGVVIGQHFRARCAENFANDSESSHKKNLRGERERERKREARERTRTHSQHRALFVFRLVFWQLVYGVPLDD